MLFGRPGFRRNDRDQQADIKRIDAVQRVIAREKESAAAELRGLEKRYHDIVNNAGYLSGYDDPDEVERDGRIRAYEQEMKAAFKRIQSLRELIHSFEKLNVICIDMMSTKTIKN